MTKQALHPRTAVINKKQKIYSKQARNTALLWLASRFPAAFDNSTRIRPLKLGIMVDILAYAEEAAAVGISRSKLREAVVSFARGIDYLTCLKAREMRIDLEGNPTVQVSEEEAERATLKIRKRVEKTAKNARKAPPGKSKTFLMHQHSTSFLEQHIPPAGPYALSNTTQQPRAAAVVIKQKRQYDPDAVARLKEKLGLSRREKDTIA